MVRSLRPESDCAKKSNIVTDLVPLQKPIFVDGHISAKSIDLRAYLPFTLHSRSGWIFGIAVIRYPVTAFEFDTQLSKSLMSVTEEQTLPFGCRHLLAGKIRIQRSDC